MPNHRHKKAATPPAQVSTIREAVIYVRVSSKEQEEGFSIPAQLLAAQNYALARGLKVLHEFADVESAKKAGRQQFTEMCKFVKAHKAPLALVVEKTDRLHRNLPDYVTMEALMQLKDLEIHLYKEGKVLAKDAKSSEKFVHGINVLLARQYLDNLSEEVKKGLNEKARQGYYPQRAPLGYVTNPKTRQLELDPDKAPVVKRLFELYATGTYSLADLHAIAKEENLTSFRSTTITRAGIHDLLCNPVYYGVFLYKGQMYEGKHTPIVSKELFDKAQAVMDGRWSGTYQKRTFAFTGLLTCGRCGCAVTAELKKGKYIYYHCTTNRGGCDKRSISEPRLAEQLGAVLKNLQLDLRLAESLRIALKESLSDEQAYHERMVATLKKQEERLAGRLRQLYVDKLDAKVDDQTYDQLKTEWEQELNEVRQKLGAHQNADKKYLEFGMQLFELAQTAFESYLRRSPAEKRELLNLVCSNCTLVDGQVIATYRKPFDLIASAPSMVTIENGPDPSDPDRCQVQWA